MKTIIMIIVAVFAIEFIYSPIYVAMFNKKENLFDGEPKNVRRKLFLVLLVTEIIGILLLLLFIKGVFL